MNINDKLNRIYQLADALESDTLTPKDKKYLVEALNLIGDGEEPKEVLNVKAKKGESRSLGKRNADKNSEWRRMLAISWLTAAMAPEIEDGLGCTSLDQAISQLDHKDLSRLGFTAETLKAYWCRYQELRNLEMHFPN